MLCDWVRDGGTRLLCGAATLGARLGPATTCKKETQVWDEPCGEVTELGGDVTVLRAGPDLREDRSPATADYRDRIGSNRNGPGLHSPLWVADPSCNSAGPAAG